MQVIKVIIIVLLLLACMGGVILGSAYWVDQKPFDDSHKHELVFQDETTPNCTSPGYKKHYTCTGCDEIFADVKGFSKLNLSDIAIAPYGHDIIPSGCNDDKVCSICNQTVQEATGHTVIKLPAVAPNCTNGGKSEGSQCSTCGQVLVAQMNLAALGHTFDNVDDYNCNDCNYVRGENECPHIRANMATEVVPPSCTEMGFTIYTCDCGEIFIGNEVAPNGHNEIASSSVAPGCITTGLEGGKYCDVCGVTTVMPNVVPSNNAHTWDGLTCIECNATRFEAETSDMSYVMGTTAGKDLTFGREGKSLDETNYPSGDAYVYNMSYAETATLTFYVTASKAGKATISVRMGCSTIDSNLEDLFHINVNGVDVDNNPDIVFPKWTKVQDYDWLELEIADVELVEGENIIKIIKDKAPAEASDKYTSRYGLNFDYMAICPEDSDMLLQDTRDVQSQGHVYGDAILVKEPSFKETGIIRSYCENCRSYNGVTLPIVSAENNYVRESGNGLKSTWHYVQDGREYTFIVDEETVRYNYDVTNEDNPFAPVNGGGVVAHLTTGSVSYDGPNKSETYYGNGSYNTEYTMTIYTPEDTSVIFIVSCCKKATKNYATSAIFKDLKINGESVGVEYSTSQIISHPTSWHVYTDFEIATLDLKAGYNTITFTIGQSLNLNGVTFVSSLPIEAKAEPVEE